MMTVDEMVKYEMMSEMEIATCEELNLVREIMSGSWNQVLDAVCYARTGYRTFEDYLNALNEEEEEDED